MPTIEEASERPKLPEIENFDSSRYPDWTTQPDQLTIPGGSEFPVSPLPQTESEKISRREFLRHVRNAGLLAIGLYAGFEASQHTQLPEEIFRAAFQHQINDHLVNNPQPVSLGMYGGSSRIPSTEQALGTTFDRQFDFLTWHQSLAYIEHKMLLAESFSQKGRIPGFSWSITNPDGERPFTYGTHAYYDQEHRAYLKEIAEKIRDTHIPIEIAFLEPNISGEPPELYADLIRYVIQVFRDVGAHNAIFTLYLSAQFPLTRPYVADYYPGHGWIDKFGISLYDLYLESPFAFHHWFPGNQGPIQASWPWLKPILDVVDGKTPIIIAETGSGRTNYHNAAAWMFDLMEFCQSIGINELNLFNVNFKRKYSGNMPQTLRRILNGEMTKDDINWGERDWSVNSSVEKRDAYQHIFAQNSQLFSPDFSLEARMHSLANRIQRDSFINTASLEKAREIDRLQGTVQA